MKRKRKKAERLNPSPRERKILSSGNFDGNRQNSQNQPLFTLAQNLEENLKRYRSLRRLFEAEITQNVGEGVWRL
jgi:hypothetical protein